MIDETTASPVNNQNMTQKHCILIGAPVDCGKRVRGCLMGPDAYRTAGLGEAITALGHTVEDIGITLGQAFSQALDKTGIRRYGHAYVPLDEALSRVVIDFSGRPGLEYHVQFVKGTVGNFDVDLFHEFFQGFVNHALATLHIDNLRGKNAHHQIETIFKAFGRAVRMATELDPRSAGVVPSTKGSL